MSFVQRPEDVAEGKKLIGNKAALLAKIEKPAAIGRLEEILELADGVMVARGDLGVELPPEQVPPLQKKIVSTARRMGKPVVVATQMLESMIVIAIAHPSRSFRCGDRDLRRCRCGDAVGGDCRRRMADRSGIDNGPDRAAGRKRSRFLQANPLHRNPCRLPPPQMRWPRRAGGSRIPSIPVPSCASLRRVRPHGVSRANARRCPCWC